MIVTTLTTPPGAERRPRRLLVVEDDRAIADAVVRRLRGSGYEVDLAHDGPAAVTAARTTVYDAIVLDVMLPGLNGLEVCRQVQATRPVPVLMLTARDEEADRLVGLAVGADDYLTKPFSFVVLVARLRALLRRDSPPRPVTLSVAGICLDPSSHRVSLDGDDIALSAREFTVLETLMRAHPRAVSKESLLDDVWGSTSAVEANVVEVYIGYLRRKLGRERIETVRGFGYRLPG